jgi:putative copper resistance protein D
MDTANIAIRLAQYLTLGSLFGLAVFALYAPKAATGLVGCRTLLVLIAAAAAASLSSIFVLAGQMSGTPAGAVDPATLWAVASGTGAGMASLVRLLALAAAALTVAARSRAPQNLPLASGVALATLAWSGHAAAEEGLFGQVRLVGDILHLLAAGVWVGALVAFVILVLRKGDAAITGRALAKFSGVGSAVVATLVATGLINTWHSVEWRPWPVLTSSPWGRALLVKLVLFAAMLLLAAANRFLLTPKLQGQTAAGGEPDQRHLRLSLIVELSAAIAVLAVVSVLGTLAPPAAS